MKFQYRKADSNDLTSLKKLAVNAWAQFKSILTNENWEILYNNLNNNNTYNQLLEKSECIVCTAENGKIIGMVFLVPSGNPTSIYDKNWSYIRLLTVHPKHTGQGIGKLLTVKCIEIAKANGEKTIALHTSEFMHQARYIYESFGFKVVKEIDQRFGKRYWLYKLDLNLRP